MREGIYEMVQFIKQPFSKIRLSTGNMWLKKSDIVMKI